LHFIVPLLIFIYFLNVFQDLKIQKDYAKRNAVNKHFGYFNNF